MAQLLLHAAYLSEGTTAIFPCTILYMDPTILEVNRMPQPDAHPR